MKDRLPPRERIAPVKAVPVSDAMENWLIAYQTGNSSHDGDDWAVVADNVSASVLIGLEMPSDPREDAEAVAAIINAYRTGRLVLAPMPLFEGNE